MQNVSFVQVQGLGTALKILYSGRFDEESDYNEKQPKNIKESLRQRFKLKRGEIVSLFNAFGRYDYIKFNISASDRSIVLNFFKDLFSFILFWCIKTQDKMKISTEFHSENF